VEAWPCHKLQANGFHIALNFLWHQQQNIQVHRLWLSKSLHCLQYCLLCSSFVPTRNSRVSGGCVHHIMNRRCCNIGRSPPCLCNKSQVHNVKYDVYLHIVLALQKQFLWLPSQDGLYLTLASLNLWLSWVEVYAVFLVGGKDRCPYRCCATPSTWTWTVFFNSSNVDSFISPPNSILPLKA
jgi:hypothetical protein